MCDFRIDPQKFEAKYGIDFRSHFADAVTALAAFEADGLVAQEGGGWKVTPAGRLLVRNLAMAFDAYLRTREGERFSRTV
jgi:oxygen-independent coproporphyrinogen III oxidase